MKNTENFEHLDKNQRFAYVIEHICKTENTTQKEIAEKLDIEKVDEYYITDLKSGKRKTITTELIKKLHQNYHVNPDFLLLKSNSPFDSFGAMLEHFESLVADWKIANGKHDNCILLKMDSNFYNFLLDCYKIQLANDDGILQLDEGIAYAQETHYTSNLSLKDYLLIPRECLTEIVQSEMENINVDSIMNFLDYKDCMDE